MMFMQCQYLFKYLTLQNNCYQHHILHVCQQIGHSISSYFDFSIQWMTAKTPMIAITKLNARNIGKIAITTFQTNSMQPGQTWKTFALPLVLVTKLMKKAKQTWTDVTVMFDLNFEDWAYPENSNIYKPQMFFFEVWFAHHRTNWYLYDLFNVSSWKQFQCCA